MTQRHNIAVLGSTGSVGCSTLDVVARNPDRYQVVALSAQANYQRLARQCQQHKARFAVISDPGKAGLLAQSLQDLGCATEVLAGPQALVDIASSADVDTVMAAIVGAAGLAPTLAAARHGKRVLLANKESMVIAGALFGRAVREGGAQIIPVDSEHNALFQALPDGFGAGLDAVGVRELILTASGGPFLDHDPGALHDVTPAQACAHPNWDMGRKISVDSATLMNKGLEVIEARWLFNARPDQIRVVIHPQSIVHSMVAYRDGSVLAQMGLPDMRTPIAHALAWPERIDAGVAPLDLTRLGALEFHEPDLQRFPCLALAWQALGAGDDAPVILNAANEVAVEAFLQGAIGFMRIADIVAEVLARTAGDTINSLEDVLACDQAARARTRQLTGNRVKAHV